MGLSAPSSILDVGNSGTTIRLFNRNPCWSKLFIFYYWRRLYSKRPMLRVINPLRKMGAYIEGIDDGKYCPLHIKGSALNGINYKLPVASAQVKSAILFASLYAKGKTTIVEPRASRDHTEIMVNYFGGNILRNKNEIISSPVKKLTGQLVEVPGDISSAAYFIAAALILPNSELLIQM